ncbi:MAG: 30S ribosomal protein S6 [Anaerolineae bacterium]|nr:30S ribosomal protein S6 [Anaerolineae bacterium]
MVTRKYELMFILNPELNEEAQKNFIDRIQGYFAEAEATVYNFKLWGFRRMAYTIRGYKEGRYYVAQFAMDTQKLAPFEHSLRMLSEGVLRELVTCLPDDFVPNAAAEAEASSVPSADVPVPGVVLTESAEEFVDEEEFESEDEDPTDD